MTGVRRAQSADAEEIGRLLHAFNTEFNEFTPGPRALAERVRTLLADGEITVLLAGAEPVGLAVLRFRPSLWKEALDVARDQGAGDMSLGTGENDIAARALYESLGFSNRESNGALNFFYERAL